MRFLKRVVSERTSRAAVVVVVDANLDELRNGDDNAGRAVGRQNRGKCTGGFRIRRMVGLAMLLAARNNLNFD